MAKRFDIGLIVPLKEEFEYLAKVCPITSSESFEGSFFYSLDFGGCDVRVVSGFVGEMGPLPAAQRTEKLLRFADVELLVVLGLAGGLDDKVKLGDVVVASEICEFLAESKAVPARGGKGFRLKYSGRRWPLNYRLREAVNNFSLCGSAFSEDYRAELRELYESLRIPRQQRRLGSESPDYHVGHIASGDIVGAAEAFAVELLGIDRKFLALEMEAAGVAKTAHDRNTAKKLLVVRGISDFADERKTSLDVQARGNWRLYAMTCAARFLAGLLRWGDFHDLACSVRGKGHRTEGDARKHTVLVNVTIDEQFFSSPEEAQERVMKRVFDLVGEGTVVQLRLGSVVLTIEMSRGKAEVLLQAVRDGVLASLGVVNAEILQSRSTVSLLAERVGELLIGPQEDIQRGVDFLNSRFRDAICARLRARFPGMPSHELAATWRRTVMSVLDAARDRRLNVDEPFFPWLWRIAYFRALDHASREEARERTAAVVGESLRGTSVGQWWQSLATAERGEIMHSVRKVISDLPESKRQVWQVLVEEFPETSVLEALQREVSAVTGIEHTPVSLAGILDSGRAEVCGLLQNRKNTPWDDEVALRGAGIDEREAEALDGLIVASFQLAEIEDSSFCDAAVLEPLLNEDDRQALDLLELIPRDSSSPEEDDSEQHLESEGVSAPAREEEWYGAIHDSMIGSQSQGTTSLKLSPRTGRKVGRPGPPGLLADYQAIIARMRDRILGSGGQGIVCWSERHGADAFTLPTALKVFSPERYESDESYAQGMAHIAHIAGLVARIQQDNLLVVYNFISEAGIRLMEMELVDGYDMHRLLQREMLEGLQDRVSNRRWRYINQVIVTSGPVQPRLKPGVAIAIIRDCLAALSALHRNGIVHGDLKPSNIMIKRTGNGKIVDIGAAFEFEAPPPRRSCTPTYAAPEVLEGDATTPRSDLASLGYVLIEMLCGAPVFAGVTSYRDLLEAKRFLAQRLPRILPEEVVCNELLMSFCRGMIAADPMRRFPSAEAADLVKDGAASFHRQLVKGDLASEYDNEIRLWLEEVDQ